MIRVARAHIRRRTVGWVAGAAACLVLGACSSNGPAPGPTGQAHAGAAGSSTAPVARASGVASASDPPASAVPPSPGQRSGRFTVAFAGDVHFAGRIGERLARDPATVFAQAKADLDRADLTVVNLETAVTTGGDAQAKLFTFRAPPVAFTALRDAGVDVVTMANNHGADYGASGLRDSLHDAAVAGFPVIGIGADARHAYAPYTSTVHGTRVAVIAADQVQDETTLRLFSAGPGTPGVASALSPALVSAVRRAKAAGYVVIVYLHWGVEYQTCPSSTQSDLAGRLADAGATAVIGTHSHVLQGAGWRKDGAYVAYGLGNYLWWRSFGNNQDDNGVLTLSFDHDRVVHAAFAPSRLDERGVPVPATGATRTRILDQLTRDRSCTDLSATPPR